MDLKIARNGLSLGASKYGTRKNTDMSDELDAQIHDLIRRFGKVNQDTARRMAQVIIADAKGDFKDYIHGFIGNEFDLQHYIENR